jgi:hypothetical protein
MELLFAIAAVLAIWAFLGVLTVGLLLVMKSLQSVRAWFERIAAGVRAIEQQSAPLATHAAEIRTSLEHTDAAFERARLSLAAADRRLADAPPNSGA